MSARESDRERGKKESDERVKRETETERMQGARQNEGGGGEKHGVWGARVKGTPIFFSLCFIKPKLGNRHGPEVCSRANCVSGHAPTNRDDGESPSYLLTLSSLKQPGMARFLPFTLTTSLAIPTPCSSSSNGPSNSRR